jgi:hypothetical protein
LFSVLKTRGKDYAPVPYPWEISQAALALCATQDTGWAVAGMPESLTETGLAVKK